MKRYIFLTSYDLVHILEHIDMSFEHLKRLNESVKTNYDKALVGGIESRLLQIKYLITEETEEEEWNGVD